MASFQYDGSPDPIRPDLADAYRRAWRHVAAPGTWLTGAERVAVAEETRRARSCTLCRERKTALSPFAVEGQHDHTGVLSASLVDEIHRVTTDAARLSEKWYRGLIEQGLAPEEYVEALGVAVIVISIDRFHHAMGLPLEPLPTASAGEPTRERPDGIVEGEAWVPMQAAKQVSPAFVLRALSLVPAELRAWTDVGDAQYLNEKEMMSFEQLRAISRSQIELVAGRVSALNECFY